MYIDWMVFMKVKKYGFTLVEMLSVIALLAALALIAIPNIDKLLKSSKAELYTNQVNLIKTGAKLWATDSDNQKMLSENEVWPYVITLYDLQNGKFIDSDIVDPKTDQKFSENMLIYIDKVDSKYVYTIDESSNDPLAPKIVIHGDTVVSLEIGATYSENGASATKPDGSAVTVTTSIKKNGTVSTIDTSKKGNYIITYSATYTENSIEHKATLARIVKIIDTTPPVITCASCGTGTIELESTDSYTLPTVTVTDNSGEEIKAILMGSFTTRIQGSKTVKYVATDSSGNSTTYTLVFNIKDTVSPTVTYSTKISGSSITYEVIALDSGSGIKEYSFDGGSTWQKSNTRSLKCNTPTTIIVKDNAGNKTSKDVTASCQNIWVYNYSGNYQTFTAPYSGWYQIEAWGAESGNGYNSTQIGGKGAYTSGKTYLTEGTKLYVYVGSQGGTINSRIVSNGGYNGGGNGVLSNDGDDSSGGGGGATDIRLISGNWNDDNSLKSRVMVAAGAGGAHSSSTYSFAEASNGGSLAVTGYVATWTNYFRPMVNQTSGGAFGIGTNGISAAHAGAGGGGGYYGGYTQVLDGYSGRAAGGSSFISGYAGVNAITSSSSLVPTNNTIHYSGFYFIDGNMVSGINSGNGKALISYVSEDKPERINLGLNNVRYIKDCANGSSSNGYANWIELQALVNGVNVAKGKTVTGTTAAHTTFLPYNVITDGDILSSNYSQPNTTGNQCITVDLGTAYNIDEIAVWHYYYDNRTYYSNITSVSSDNTNWVTVISNSSAETVLGKRVNAFTYPKYEYAYVGDYQTFTAPISGFYNIELFGAEGGDATYTTTYSGGFGSYTKGKTYLSKGDTIYVYVGGQGQTVTGTTAGTLTANGNGYNGGAPGSFAASNSTHGGGGGATDVRTTSGVWNNATSLNSRIMVAGGGGGASSHSSTPSYSGNGGSGGTLIGNIAVNANTTCYAYGTGGTQTTGGISITCPTNGQAQAGSGSFGIGYSTYTSYNAAGNLAGGGGGYYGGGVGYHAAGGGGSSFISGYAGVNAITSSSSTTATNNTIHYSNRYFVDSNMSENVNSGNGRALITYSTNSDSLQRVNTKLNGVRYIKDCANGNTINSSNHWIELQAIVNGINVAKGKTVTGTGTLASGKAYSLLVDGIIGVEEENIIRINETTGLQCVTIDLGQKYDLDEIAVWHFWKDGRTYYANTTSVSSDNTNWITAIANNDVETPNGKRVNAYSTNKIESTNVYTFTYSGSSETFTAPYSGWYKVELWGAQGGRTTGSDGQGGYTSGKIYLNSGETLNVNVGGAGTTGGGTSTALLIAGGYNGGAGAGNQTACSVRYWGSGGGATDVRLDSSLNSRIMVAGAGGGCYGGNNACTLSGATICGGGGIGGNLIAGPGTTTNNYAYGDGATQINGGLVITGSGKTSVLGTFGIGGGATEPNTCKTGGGGGYYGGSGSGHIDASGGGSSFISGYAGVNAITSSSSLTPTNNTKHYSNKYFLDGQMQANVNSGNGKAQITFLSSDNSSVTRTNTLLNNVRYIKDCVNGNSTDLTASWVELQAIYNGVNVAKGKTVTGSSAENATYPYSRIVDGDITSANYAMSSVNNAQCVTIDLGAQYNLDEVAVWHYYADGRIVYSNVTSVSSNNTAWTPVISNTDAETSNGKRVSAYSTDTTTPGQNVYYTYTGGVQTFTPEVSGWYNVELWGAQGAAAASKGAYASGKLYLTPSDTIYVYVGEGLKAVTNTTSYNGGTGNSGGTPGGGATDIRLIGGDWFNDTGLKSRIMVAAGSGSGSGNSNTTLGAGGTLIGNSGNGTVGGTQLTFGAVQSASYTVSSFGIANGGCAGGNGYYPGGGATCSSGAGGGSSFISGFAGVNAITSSSSLTPTYNTIHYSGKYFYTGKMTAGVNAGNGKARIRLLTTASTLPRIVPYLNNVRYIKDCINGSTANTNNHWVELQAIVNGVNVAKGKTVTGTIAENATYPYSRLTDGDITSTNYAQASTTGLQCLTVDLGASYNIDEIAVWHYYVDGRTYYSNVTYVSSDNSNFTPIIYKQEAETPFGKRINAYEN